MTVFHQPAIRWFQTGWHWTLLLIIISILLGMLFRLLLRFRFTQEEIFLLVLGIIIFTSGAGFYLRLSPILMTTIVGITIAQFPRESEKVLRVIHTGEKPTYLFLLIFAGAMWNYRFWEEILLILAFIVARYLGKYIGGYVSAKKIPCDFPIPPDIGKGMMSLGGVSLAIAFNYQLYYGGFMGDFLMSATIIGLLLFDEYSALSILSILKNSREIK
jgi:Kef-type K+ transport system membrane component KefB